MKFGGTSVADLDRIRNVAKRVKAEYDKGNEVAVVVSAMSGVTNQLVAYCQDAGELYDTREYDTIVSTGEQVTVGLLSIVLQGMGVNARSWLGWQLPFRTDNSHGNAQIKEINTSEIEERFKEGQVAVMAGFQGVSPNNRIATLGRGGSDTSAVALAAAMNADRCDIYTDVDGVYTTDPRITPKARKIDRITYEEMLELASVGAKVLQTRSVSMAMRYNTRLQVLSSFEDKPGTLVCGEDEVMEENIVTGIAYSRDEAKITLRGISDNPGIASSIFGAMGDAAINVDMIVQTLSEENRSTDMSFTVGRADLKRAVNALEAIRSKINCDAIESDATVAKVSVVGVGMRSHAGVAQRMFATLADKGINIQLISTSEIKVSVLIAEEYLELAVRSLHTAYGLDNEEAA